jgi:hypothetical protein
VIEIALTPTVKTWLRFRQPPDAPTVERQTPAVQLFVGLYVLPFAPVVARPPQRPPDTHTLNAVLDTGAPLTLFPHTVWQPFAGDVRWLDPTPTSVWNLRVGGCAYDYRMGEVRLCAFDTTGNVLPAVPCYAAFLEPAPVTCAAPLATALLGLHAPLLLNRAIGCAADSTAAQLGRRWFLRDL